MIDTGIPYAPLRVLCLGDVVGRPGRTILKEVLPKLRETLELDWVIANGENAAGGIGITPETLRDIINAGVDVVTTGNHVWKHRSIYSHLQSNPRLLRPANYGTQVPGQGLCLHTLPDNTVIAVINLIGRTWLPPVDCPFAAAEALLATLPSGACCFVDFHAEATSEKRAMSLFLDGRVTAVCGTHTHVQTADATILPGGTATITDLGMCGVEAGSVLGMAKEPVLARFLTGLPHAFKPATGTPALNGLLLYVNKTTGKVLSTQLIRGTTAQILSTGMDI